MVMYLSAAQQVTVLSIAALKKVKKGTRILLLDRNGGQSKSIAKELSRKGFKKVAQQHAQRECTTMFYVMLW
jgi:rhodanese-related sulfurtransferase